ncbi:MAG: hypothetical protein AAF698_01520, partial [Pseudomonadota bacterium]
MTDQIDETALVAETSFDMPAETAMETAAETGAEAKAAAFLEGFERFREEVSGSLATIGKRVDTLSAKAAHMAARPALSTAAEA